MDTDNYQQFCNEIDAYIEAKTFGMTSPTPLVTFAQVLTTWAGLAMQMVVPVNGLTKADRQFQVDATREVEGIAFRWLFEHRISTNNGNRTPLADVLTEYGMTEREVTDQ